LRFIPHQVQHVLIAEESAGYSAAALFGAIFMGACPKAFPYWIATLEKITRAGNGAGAAPAG
jgi:hypothetical protein